MFRHHEPFPAPPGSHRRGGPVPLRAIWLELRDALRETCKSSDAVQKVPGADLESPPTSFSHAA
jgi:hypothetical protein